MQGLRFGDRVPYRGQNQKVIIEIPLHFLTANQKAKKNPPKINKKGAIQAVFNVFNGTLKESSPLFLILPKDCIDLLGSQ